MNCDTARSLMSEWIDDELPERRRREVESHLAECTDCRDAEAELRELLARVAALPRAVEPARDLWPGILGGIESQKVVRPRFGNHRGLWLAAAALLLVIASSGLTAVWMRSAVVLEGDPSAAVNTVAWEQFRAAETEYDRVTDELLAALDGRRDELAPETIEIVESNLALIDEAIREARTALERDPANAGLATTLTDIYRKRVDFLQAMNRL